ncbi:phage integrase N-terminal SAM-like domain-containing protein [Sphingobium sp. SA916]|uniref:phage integrase N-terminal SAM-like domain-containing protein n=1 Tax=Sphingobium sp. SA916 TaxID=1851207 RepID=UPI00209C11D4|nr:phage integrase N-terminal SAM-like domain-containing protein [Sphingobium sp. SA916]
MTDVTVTVSPLRRRMIDDMSLRNLSPATQRSYLHAITKFSRYFGRSPDRLGLEDVRAFQVYLVSQGISCSHTSGGAESGDLDYTGQCP